MSAIRDNENFEPIQVLITLHDNMSLLDLAGPLQVLNHAQHDANDEGRHSPLPSTLSNRALANHVPVLLYRHQSIRIYLGCR